ncbi:MAG: CHAT domain-containing tetratricopeptide repeat protein, partial [Bacteroidota bacterium]
GDDELPAALSQLASAFGFYGDMEMALAYNDSAIAMARRVGVNDPINFPDIFINHGKLYRELGDYDNALLNYRHAIQILDTISFESPAKYVSLATTHLNMGRVEELKENYAGALAANRKAAAILKAHPNRRVEIHNLNNLGIVQRHLGRYDSSLYYLRAEAALQGETHSKLGRTMKQMGETFLGAGKLDSAAIYLRRAVKMREADYQGVPHPNVAKVWKILGDVLQAKESLAAALKCYRSAANAISAGTWPDRQPPPDSVLFPGEMLTVLPALAQVHRRLFLQSNDPQHLHQALAILRQADPLIDRVRRRLLLESSKIRISDQTQTIYEAAVTTCYDLFAETQDPQFVRDAFHFADRNKAALLREAVRTTGAAKLGTLPETIRSIEREIGLEIAYLSKQKGREGDILALQTRLDSLKQIIQTEHPAHYWYVHEAQDVSVENVQNALQPNQDLLSYFLGDSVIYAFFLNKSGLGMRRLERPATLHADIEALRKALEQPKTTVETFAQPAHRLYQHLVAPLANALTGDRLTLILDGGLHFIPFEILLTQATSGPFDGLPYLLRDKALSYQFSAALMVAVHAQQNTHTDVQPFLGLAPTFSATHSGLPNLPSGPAELAAGQALFGDGDTLLGPAADKPTFIRRLLESRNIRVLHLSTHAHADLESPAHSWIAFSDRDSSDFRMYLDEIYHYPVHSEMVVLSACATGTGSLKTGEGVLSLARGFYLGGSQAVVSTRWKIQDMAAAKIMRTFYAALGEGMDKDLALREAQLAWLADPELGHNRMPPHFWAAFRVTGDVRALVETGSGIWLWLGIGGLVLVLLSTIWWRRRNVKRT